jgi:hypothetical protein
VTKGAFDFAEQNSKRPFCHFLMMIEMHQQKTDLKKKTVLRTHRKWSDLNFAQQNQTLQFSNLKKNLKYSNRTKKLNSAEIQISFAQA